MTTWPNLREDDFTLRDFRFASGETLPELRQHVITLGTPRTDAAGRIVNALAADPQHHRHRQNLA